MNTFRLSQFLLPLYLLTACGGTGNTNWLGAGTSFYTGQAAGSVIGQTDFHSRTFSTSATTQYGASGIDLSTNGEVRISDISYSRVLVYTYIPEKNSTGTPANYVLGQPSFTSNTSAPSATANTFGFVLGIRSGGGKFAVADLYRVLIYNSLPSAGNPNAAVAVGAVSTTTNSVPACSANSLLGPNGVAIGGTKLLIADTAGKRVLIYNSVPNTSGASADLVLGENSLSVCTGGTSASLMSSPQDVWSDGTRVVVADSNRVLIWNNFPTFNGQPADLVLGQSSMNTATLNLGGISAQSLNSPNGIASDGTRLVISDGGNNRVLIWNHFPTTNNQAADVVLGQNDFVSRVASTTATGLSFPDAVAMDASHILVADSSNNRVMIWYAQ